LVRERIGAHVMASYASNETNRISVVGDDDVGTLVPGATVRIVDDAGAELPIGSIGVIQAKTSTMVDGYYNDPEATRAAFVDGWYHTNDAGMIPQPGKLIVLGRADDMLNIGGIKIAPHAIEDELKTIGGIADAALVAVTSPTEAGELVVALEIAGGGLSRAAEAAARRIVGRYLRHYHLLPLTSFPRTENGKLRRQEIEAAFVRRNG
ncbi:MAG: AMP-binding protein, partial [Proteobacteria bacterium]|nr:AMP-binding protein [Pseudomonadota bacterium]